MKKELTHKDICPYYEESCIDIGCVCPKYLAYEKANKKEEIEKQLMKMNVDYNLDKLNIIMDIQRQFSSRFFDVNELSDKDVSEWIKQYDVCIHDEITEIHEHLDLFEEIYGEKITNKNELKKELIDILHFVVDMFIVGKINVDVLFCNYLINAKKDICEENKKLSFLFEHEEQMMKKNKQIVIDAESMDSVSVLILTGHLMASLRKVRQQIDWKHWKKKKNTIDYKKLHESFTSVLSSLIKCCIILEINCEELYEIYVKKNIENIFRQEFGY